MKLVVLIIPPELTNKLLDDIDAQHLHVLTIGDVQGFRLESGSGYADMELLPKVRVEVTCEDDEVDALVDCINGAIDSSQWTQGNILVMPIESVRPMGAQAPLPRGRLVGHAI